MNPEDNLAETIRSGVPGAGQDEETIKPAWAANRVRERFVVIDRDDLPEVQGEAGTSVRIGGPHWFEKGLDSEGLRRHAYRLLVAADWIDAQPSVDEKAVEELTATLRDAIPDVYGSVRKDLARRLIADGWVKP